MLLYPLLFQLGFGSGLGTEGFGVYIGATVHEVAQVVAAGDAISPQVGETAVVTKMIRVMLLAPFLLFLALFLSKDTNQIPHTGTSQNNQKADDAAHTPSNTSALKTFIDCTKQVNIPWFAFLFIAIVFLHSWLPLSANITQTLITIDNLFLTMAMFALA